MGSQMFSRCSHRCSQMFYRRRQMFNVLKMFAHVPRCSQMFTDDLRCSQMFSDVLRMLSWNVNDILVGQAGLVGLFELVGLLCLLGLVGLVGPMGLISVLDFVGMAGLVCQLWLYLGIFWISCLIQEYFYRTRVRSLFTLVTNWLTHSLTHWLTAV